MHHSRIRHLLKHTRVGWYYAPVSLNHKLRQLYRIPSQGIELQSSSVVGQYEVAVTGVSGQANAMSISHKPLAQQCEWLYIAPSQIQHHELLQYTVYVVLLTA